MLEKILIGLAVLVALFLVVVALRPSEFHVERTAPSRRRRRMYSRK
jgi:hypothetical protein